MVEIKKSPKKTKSVSSTSLLRIIQFSLTTFKACTIGIQVNYGDLKQIDSDISPAKMGLLEISRELQPRFCNHGKPSESSYYAREGQVFRETEKKLGGL